ncbi:hypothetical protein BKA65DRAFT_485907 [Rhexocercosporidium sp. MPI-PUGE-AT-0058]|nr:hypothetical protein BKA65DRAFT_485907 [Rhexocercosporidium sp. MPI-PUGE-AT-0058]
MANLEHPGFVQLNSPLLSLPREVRDMIWKSLMGGMIIHLWIDENDWKKLRGSCCWAEDENCRLRCQAWLQKKGKAKWPTIGVYGLILACAQSINVMPSLILCWTLPKPPSLSEASRRFCLQGKVEAASRGCSRYQREWIETWSSLASMQGLQSLRVEMNTVGRESITGVWEGSDLEIVKIIKRPEIFVVVMGDESAKRMRRLVRAPNMTIVGIIEEEAMARRKLLQTRDKLQS